MKQEYNKPIERQLSLFPDSDDAPRPQPVETSRPSVETDVTRVVHSGLVMRPVYELAARRLAGPEEAGHSAWEHLDVIWLAFAALDIISEMTEYAPGVSREEVVSRLIPLAGDQTAAIDRALDQAVLEEVLHKIFDHLVNRENRYRPFEYTYFDAPAHKMTTKKFWLIKTVYTGEGQTALFHLTDEGYTAYFGLYETGALDAAAIGNLRIRLLIDRGRVDDAIGVAQQNQKQLLRKSHELKAMGRAIRRNINRVDAGRVNTMADEGARQTRQVQEESARLHHLVRQKLMADATGPDLRHKLSILGETLEKLNLRLLELSGDLQGLPETYDRHSHKLFRRPAPGILPSCEQALNRLAGLSASDGADLGQEFMARFDPPVCRPLFNPAAVMEACDRALERQNQAEERASAIQEIENIPIEKFESRLSQELMDQAFHFLKTIVHEKAQISLSRVLEAACEEGLPPLLPVAVAMAVFHCLVDPFHREKYQVAAALNLPETLFSLSLPHRRQYRGHELILTPKLPGGLPRPPIMKEDKG